MQVELYLDPQAIAAICDRIPASEPARSLAGEAYAPNLNKILEWTDRMWSSIQTAVHAVAEKGREEVETWMARLKVEIADLRQDLGEESHKVVQQIEAKLAVARQETWQAMLNLLPPTMTIQGAPVRLQEVTLEYSLTTQVTLEVSILKLLDVAAGGAVQVGAKYALPAAP